MRVPRYWRFGLGAAALVGALGALDAGGALAQQPPAPTYPECTKKATPQDNELAKNAHKLAASYYERADYDKAVQFWNEALKHDCTVNDLLVNIANSYEKKGDKAAAVATLETYLKRTGPNTTLEAKIQNLKAAMAPPTPSVTATVTVAPTVTAAPTVTPTATATVPPPVADGPRPFGYTPLYVAGGGAVAAIVGAILVGVGTGQVSSAESACGSGHHCSGPDAQANADKGNAGRYMQGAGVIALPVGVVAAAGGVVWHFVFNKPGTAKPAKTGARKLWISPTAGAGTSGLVVGGTF